MKSALQLARAACLVVMAVSLALPAFAGVGVSVAPTYPNIVDVGDTGLSATLKISNGAFGTEATEQLLISNIRHTPACGSSDFPCPVGQKDPGVFKVNSPASGSAGSCVGMTFNVAITDASTGTVTFTPQSGDVILEAKNNPNDNCTISFTVDVLKVPTHDASSNPGVMTNQLAAVSAKALLSQTTGSGAGAGQTTIRAPGETCVDCTRATPAVGFGGSVALAILLLGGGLGVMRHRRSRRA